MPTTIAKSRPPIRMMNWGHIERELRIMRQIMNTNNQQIAPDIAADDITDNLYNDIIIVVSPTGKNIQLGTKCLKYLKR